MSDTTEQLKQAAANPKDAASDGQRVSQHSLADQIAMDQYLAAKKAANTPGSPVRFHRLIPPGGTGV